jgi:hypothetical protein
MAETHSAGDNALKVFISYSRKDREFAQPLISPRIYGGIRVGAFAGTQGLNDTTTGLSGTPPPRRKWRGFLLSHHRTDLSLSRD